VPDIDYIDISSSYVAEHYPIIVYAQPRLMDLPPGAILGTWHYSIPGQMRFILDKSVEVAPGVMPGDLARAWIRDQYILPLKRRKAQLQIGYTVPIHARKGEHGSGAYVDIRKAYIQILRLGWDVQYELGQYIYAEPRPVPPQIAANKFAYATAISMTRNSRSSFDVMGKEGVYERQPMNTFSNPCLYNLANETLNGIGAEILLVLKDHCHYINTDGYIVDEGYEGYAIDIVRSWGFEARVKAEEGAEIRGPVRIGGVGSWKVGEHATVRYDAYAESYTNDLMSLDELRWLKSQWWKWSQRL
jgi:hypothetical protein